MNQYQLSYFVRLPDGTLRAATQMVAAPCATVAIMQLDTLLLPAVRVGAVTWSLVGPPLRAPVRPRLFRRLAA